MSMIQVQEARDQILSKIKIKGVEKVSLDQALGRVLSEDVISQINNPPLDNSAMDGYALIAADIQSATPEAQSNFRWSKKSPQAMRPKAY